MTDTSWIQGELAKVSADLVARMKEAQAEIEWVRNATARDLLELASDQIGVKAPDGVFEGMSAAELGDLPHADIMSALEPNFTPGTSTADDLADQVHLSRAFANPRAVTDMIAKLVEDKVAMFPKEADDLKVGHNQGDVLDPFLLAANYELLSGRRLVKTIEYSASHKVLMKIEDMAGHLHENVIALMRGNFRIPEPRGTKKEKEKLDPILNPFPGCDVGQVPVSNRPGILRLFQVKSKTGSAKGGDGVRLGEQLLRLEKLYGADTFYVAVVGNTLKGHRSRGAVERTSPNTAIMVGEAALDELTQSRVGGEMLLQTYQRAFRQASEDSGYDFDEVVERMIAVFQKEAEAEEGDFLAAWLHQAVGGDPKDQDSRLQK